MLVLEYQGGRHRVRETPVAAHIRRACADDRFFTYYNMAAGTWVLAYWLRPGRLCVELLLADDPNGFDKEGLEWVKRWHKHKTPDGKNIAERVKSAERAYWRDYDDRLAEDLAFKRHLGKKAGVHLEDHNWFKVPGLAAVA